MGFEPTRAEHIELAVQRLNHSRWTACPMCFARVSSNPILVVLFTFLSRAVRTQNVLPKWLIFGFLCSCCPKCFPDHDFKHGKNLRSKLKSDRTFYRHLILIYTRHILIFCFEGSGAKGRRENFL